MGEFLKPFPAGAPFYSERPTRDGTGGKWRSNVGRTDFADPPRSVTFFEAGTIVDVIELETICHPFNQ